MPIHERHFEFDEQPNDGGPEHHSGGVAKIFLRDPDEGYAVDENAQSMVPAEFAASVEGTDGGRVEKIKAGVEYIEGMPFYLAECSPTEAEFVRSMHMRVIGDDTLFVGQGNYATVHDLVHGSRYCAKHVWNDVATMVKGGDLSKLDPRYQPLVKVKRHFDEVKRKRRAYDTENIVFPPQNDPLVEAAISNKARDVLNKAGMGNMIPNVNEVYTFKDEVNGHTKDGTPFLIVDEASILIMERVPGFSIQDLILNYGTTLGVDDEVIKSINLPQFKNKLMQAFDRLHAEGITHQDVSNRNIMINIKTLEPVIIDFGAASTTHGNMTFSKDEELNAVTKVCAWLGRFQNDPSTTKASLEKRLGI